MNKYIVGPFVKKTNIAGGKFPNDMITIFKSKGYKYLPAHEMYYFKNEPVIAAHDFLTDVRGWLSIPKKSLVVYIDQVVPRYNRNLLFRILKNKQCKIGSLLEDIDILRTLFPERERKQAINLLNTCEFVISQNSKMTKKIKELGVSAQTYELNVLDFLTTSPIKERAERTDRNTWRICYGGNLSYQQSGFIYELPIKTGIEYNIYGPELPKNHVLPKCVTYKGVFDAENCVGNIEGDWGLVWNGQSLENSSNDLRNTYYKYVSPHKFSMYLLCGMPVIVSRESAMADFVVKNECGIIIDSIRDIADKLSLMSASDYKQYCEKTKYIAERISQGYYTYSVIHKMEKSLES